MAPASAARAGAPRWVKKEAMPHAHGAAFYQAGNDIRGAAVEMNGAGRQQEAIARRDVIPTGSERTGASHAPVVEWSPISSIRAESAVERGGG
jgi:hypothetical protein